MTMQIFKLRIIRIVLSITSLLFVASCSKDTDKVSTEPVASGSVTDKDGNTYNWVQIGNQQWTTTNARSGEPFYEKKGTSSLYDLLISVDDASEVRKFYQEYGNLYSYEEAVANAPEGWHLPDDQEWMELEKNAGLSAGEANSIGWRGDNQANELQKTTEGSKIGLKLGGLAIKKERPFILRYEYFKDYGYYWTSTVVEESPDRKKVYFRKLVTGSGKVGRYVTETDKYMSVRYTKIANIK